MLNLLFRLGLQQVYGPATEKVREAYFPLPAELPAGACVCRAGCSITHSIPENVDTRRFDPSIFTRQLDSAEFYERTGVFELVWGRDYRAGKRPRRSPSWSGPRC